MWFSSLYLSIYMGRSYLLLRGQRWLCQTHMHAGWKLCSPVFGRPRISWGGIKHAQGCLWTTVSASAALFFSLSLSITPTAPSISLYCKQLLATAASVCVHAPCVLCVPKHEWITQFMPASSCVYVCMSIYSSLTCFVCVCARICSQYHNEIKSLL